jgi:hypothetical protein
MKLYTIRLFLQNALHDSGGSPVRHQELKNYTYNIWHSLSRCYHLALSWRRSSSSTTVRGSRSGNSNHVEHFKNNCINSHAENTIVAQPNAFLNEIHPLLFTNKGRSAFHNANNCQGQLQTPQSVSVLNQLVMMLVLFNWRHKFRTVRTYGKLRFIVYRTVPTL